MPIRAAAVLAAVTLALHLVWCAWVLFGWVVTRRRPVLRALHIASLIYAVMVEAVSWVQCPLTLAENWFEVRAGIEPSRGPFLVRVLDALVYPSLPGWLVISGAVLVCSGILSMYLRRYLRKPAPGQW